MKYQLIVLFGPPGSGKGTQASILEKDENYVQLGMSTMLLDYIDNAKNNEDEKLRITRIQDNFKKGELVGFDDVVSIMRKKFKKNLRKGKKMTLDGFPRTENQAIWLSGLIIKEKVKTLFIHFDLKFSTVLKRIENRWFIEGSKEIFNSYEDALSHCNGHQKPFRRDLDLDINIIEKRYKEQYSEEKDEIIDGFKNNPFVDVFNIDADQSVEEITTIIEKGLIWIDN
jgi:adenylate kinase